MTAMFSPPHKFRIKTSSGNRSRHGNPGTQDPAMMREALQHEGEGVQEDQVVPLLPVVQTKYLREDTDLELEVFRHLGDQNIISKGKALSI